MSEQHGEERREHGEPEGAEEQLDELALAELLEGDTLEAPGPVEGDEQGSDDPVAVLAAERDSYLDSLRRLQAEFENFRKRVSREREDLLSRASEALVERLLPVLDALDLALAHADANKSEDQSIDGSLGQITNLLRDILHKEGLDAIAAVEVAFDPRVHDAVLHEPSGEGPSEPTVIEVLRPGYELHGKVLRPAMVKVRG